MKTNLIVAVALGFGSIIRPGGAASQSPVDCKTYLNSLPKNLELVENAPQKYLMTAEYFNKDIYGNLWGKVKVTGEYTRGLGDGFVCWNNAYISQTNDPSGLYQEKEKQEYMENFRYVPSAHIVEESFFKDFPAGTANIFARNLIWDMFAIEKYAWKYLDSLELNKTFRATDLQGGFDMADIGAYDHTNVELVWTGISMINGNLCAIVEYRALDNKLEIDLSEFKSKGSEAYWGKTWISLETRQIEYAEMYSLTIQEMEGPGIPEKMLTSTKRAIAVEKIK